MVAPDAPARNPHPVALTPETVAVFLDAAIRAYRMLRDTGPILQRESAGYYVDALQSVRYALLGEILPSSAPTAGVHWSALMTLAEDHRHD